MILLHLLVAGTSADQPVGGPGSDPLEMAFAFAILVIIFVLLYIFREKLKRNKYDPNKIIGKVWTRWGPWPP